MDLHADGCEELTHCDAKGRGKLRWLHLNLANHGTREWIERCSELPKPVRQLLLSSEMHQRATVEKNAVGLVLHDYERDFDQEDTARIGALRVAITPKLIVTARLHPLRSADIMRRRLLDAENIGNSAAALDILIGSIVEDIAQIVRRLTAEVQSAEDALFEERSTPKSRDLMNIRRRLVQVHRMLTGMSATFTRLDEDEDLPDELEGVIGALVQRITGLDADVGSLQAALRLLRDELELQATNRTNQNLYTLSVMTALLLPATLVTGIFGMNTGGMPWHDSATGTLVATTLAGGAAWLSYAFLRRLGLFQR